MATNELRQERAALLLSIRALCEWVGFGFAEAVPVYERVVGADCPDPHGIPVKALRRLDKALRTFSDEALDAESAKLQRKVERGA